MTWHERVGMTDVILQVQQEMHNTARHHLFILEAKKLIQLTSKQVGTVYVVSIRRGAKLNDHLRHGKAWHKRRHITHPTGEARLGIIYSFAEKWAQSNDYLYYCLAYW